MSHDKKLKYVIIKTLQKVYLTMTFKLNPILFYQCYKIKKNKSFISKSFFASKLSRLNTFLCIIHRLLCKLFIPGHFQFLTADLKLWSCTVII